jgi:hypothetical protein
LAFFPDKHEADHGKETYTRWRRYPNHGAFPTFLSEIKESFWSDVYQSALGLNRDARDFSAYRLLLFRPKTATND